MKYYYRMVAEKLQPCYLDINLKIVGDKTRAVAILNAYRGTRLQVLFLKPIAHNVYRNTAWYLGRKWVEIFYPKYYYPGEVPLPAYDTCIVANQGRFPPPVKGCMTSTEYEDAHGRRVGWICLDDDGKPTLGTDRTVLSNLYVSLFIELEFFKELNPSFDLGKYLIRWYKNI